MWDVAMQSMTNMFLPLSGVSWNIQGKVQGTYQMQKHAGRCRHLDTRSYPVSTKSCIVQQTICSDCNTLLHRALLCSDLSMQTRSCPCKLHMSCVPFHGTSLQESCSCWELFPWWNIPNKENQDLYCGESINARWYPQDTTYARALFKKGRWIKADVMSCSMYVWVIATDDIVTVKKKFACCHHVSMFSIFKPTTRNTSSSIYRLSQCITYELVIFFFKFSESY